MARAPYNAHTNNLFKKLGFLKFRDLVYLNQCIFMRQYSNKQQPISFHNMFQYLPLSQQVFRDHDYNFLPKGNIKPNLKFFPIVQMLRAWNCSNITIKSEAQIVLFPSCLESKQIIIVIVVINIIIINSVQH